MPGFAAAVGTRDPGPGTRKSTGHSMLRDPVGATVRAVPGFGRLLPRVPGPESRVPAFQP